jgi:TonB family protein
MRLVLAPAVIGLALVQCTGAVAQQSLGVYSPPYTWLPVGAVQTASAPANQAPIRLALQGSPPNFAALSDGLDDWCKTVSLPSSIAICSDRDLRALVLERQHAYDEAKARLDADRQKALLADQNSWVRSYARACGLGDDPPSLPLAAALKDCMAQAGRARIAYLREYGTTTQQIPPASATAPSLAVIPPQPPGPTATRDEYLAYLVALARQHIDDLLPLSVVGDRRGETVVSVVVTKDGTIGAIRIARGSGYADIDQRIAQMVKAVGRFPPLPQWYQGSEVELSLTLRFPEALDAHQPPKPRPPPVQLASPAAQEATRQECLRLDGTMNTSGECVLQQAAPAPAAIPPFVSLPAQQQLDTQQEIAAGTKSAVYRCHDPKTNFDYERPEPCAVGDVTLSGPVKPPTIPSATISADYRGVLSAWLESHKQYPETARRRGEAGRAVLRFRLERSGHVLDYSIVSSTGYPDLDASIEAMIRSATLPPFPPNMTEPEIEVSVGVRFGLQADTSIPGPPQSIASRDPLLDAVHKELVTTASDLCAEADLAHATKKCSGAGLTPEAPTQEEATARCARQIASSMAEQCPDGPGALVAKWEATRLSNTINFRDFVLDKEEMARPDEYGVGKLVNIRGVYIRAADNMDYLLAPGEINPVAYGRGLNSDTAIPLLLDDTKIGGTDRKTRAVLMTCREKYPPETFTGCTVMLSGFVHKCTITMQLTNASHEAVCIKVSHVTVVPRD